MKALIYKGPGKKAWEEMPDPKIEQPTDVIVKMVATTICGTDLHILKGDVPEVEVGRILGHEGIGVITEVGEGVTQLALGDRVIVACVSSCGKCSNCRKGLYSHCLDPEGIAGIGWIFGYMIDGTQAEYVRVPFAENSVYKVPDGMTDAEGILLSDVLPTGFEIGVQYGGVAPGDVVAVIGSGPVGLSAVMTARLYGPSKVIAIDLDNARLARAAASVCLPQPARCTCPARQHGPASRRASERHRHPARLSVPAASQAGYPASAGPSRSVAIRCRAGQPGCHRLPAAPVHRPEGAAACRRRSRDRRRRDRRPGARAAGCRAAPVVGFPLAAAWQGTGRPPRCRRRDRRAGAPGWPRNRHRGRLAADDSRRR